MRCVLCKVIPARVFPVGRLTDRGAGADRRRRSGKPPTHPGARVPKTYCVTVGERLTADKLSALRDGVMLDDGRLPADVEVRGAEENRMVLRITLYEAKTAKSGACARRWAPVLLLKRETVGPVRLSKRARRAAALDRR